jgi:hypothetical protein
MRTSNKLIVAALLLFIVSLVWYDYLLKAAYESGTYRDPYANFANLKFKDFDTVDVISSTATNVKFVQGPFGVRVDPNAMSYSFIKQSGRRLQINAVYEYNYYSDLNPYIIVISCPKLSELIASATYRSNNKQITDTIVREEWKMRQVLVEGFKQDSLTINQDYGSTVVLSNNKINLIKATIGKSPGSGSKLIVLANNQFSSTKLDILNNSKLLLDNAPIGDLNYHLADSAKLILTGKAQNLLNHTKQNQK